jgi:hypothetical protein
VGIVQFSHRICLGYVRYLHCIMMQCGVVRRRKGTHGLLEGSEESLSGWVGDGVV